MTSDSNPGFDPIRYKRFQHDEWNEKAAGWHRWEATLALWLGGVTQAMLDAAQLAPGQRVLDIATGAGEPGLSAAARVGPDGYVLATDLSENILQFAQGVANQRGVHNFETRVMDGENVDLPDASFDVVLCRLGLMLMPDQQRALTEWRRVLKPGGRVVVAVFSTPDKNGWGSVPISTIRKHVQLPAPLPGQPGPFSLGGAGVLVAALQQAGFHSVQTHILSAPLHTRNAAEYSRFAREALGGIGQLMAHLSQQERDSIWDEVEKAMRVYEGPDGLVAPGEPLVSAAVK
jgi:SAM-dependent methyltransferase